ncbi:MAG: truA [Ferruginibacter sp.]|nr:truA [Ferruginibacter sp.]
MPRFFIEVAYKGTAYAGFQVQQNANTVQAEIEKALSTYYRQDFSLTGSSRTDAGVHARQNYFHFDAAIDPAGANKAVYHLNAILPADIVVKQIVPVKDGAHCRFDALSRRYAYTIYSDKDPFMEGMGFYYPYDLDLELLNEGARQILAATDFESFAKRNSQVHTFNCSIHESEWEREGKQLVYYVRGNRFLRGMVRGLVGTMLKLGRGKLTPNEFSAIIEAKDPTKADFSMPAHGLTLLGVSYPEGFLGGL